MERSFAEVDDLHWLNLDVDVDKDIGAVSTITSRQQALGVEGLIAGTHCQAKRLTMLTVQTTIDHQLTNVSVTNQTE